MGQVHGDRVLETTTSTTSPFTLLGAVAGYRAFSAVALNNGDTFYYTIHAGTEWEVGLGTRTGATTFTRTTVLASSNAGAAVTFAAGTKEVWMDIPARLLQMFTPSISPYMVNGFIYESHAGNAVTYGVRTLAGSIPSAADPVFFVFTSAFTGAIDIRIVTAALTITVASGATLGVVNGSCPRIWLAAIDNSGTVELVVRNCTNKATGEIQWFSSGDGFISTTVQAGAADDSALVSYSVAARSTVPFVVLGHYTYDTSLATAGVWAVAPAYIVHYSPQMPKPGDVIQTRRFDDSTETTAPGSGTYVDTTLAVTITPSSVANGIKVRGSGVVRLANTTSLAGFRLRNTTAVRTVGPDFPSEVGAAVVLVQLAIGLIEGTDFPLSVSAQTFKIQFYDAATSGTFAKFPGNGNDASIIAEEIMT